MTAVIGVDPGLAGGLAVVIDGKLIHGGRMPIVNNGREDGKDRVDCAALWRYFSGYAAATGTLIMIERIGIRPGQSAQSAVTTGRNYGAVETAAHLSGAAVDFVQPQKWQKELGVSAPKGGSQNDRKRASQAVAARLFPGEGFERMPLARDGLWEAALIALYGWRTAK